MPERLYERGGTDTEAWIPPAAAPPINPVGSFAPKPYGEQQAPTQQQASQAQPPAASVPAPAQNPNFELAKTVANIAGSASAGFGAGAAVEQTPYAGDAALQTASAGIQGAASGAALGTSIAPGPGTVAGAAIGGVLGLVTGGINSYMGLRRARAQRRQQERQFAEIRKMQQEERDYRRLQDSRNRKDNFENMRYNRNLNRVQSQWTAFNAAMSRVNDLLKNNAEFRESFIRGTR